MNWLDYHIQIESFTPDSLMLSLGGVILAAIMVERAGRLVGDTLAGLDGEPITEHRAKLANLRRTVRDTAGRRTEYLQMGEASSGEAIQALDEELRALRAEEQALGKLLKARRLMLAIGTLASVALAVLFTYGGLRVFAVIGVTVTGAAPETGETASSAISASTAWPFHIADMLTSTALILGGGEGVRTMVERFAGIAERPLTNAESGAETT